MLRCPWHQLEILSWLNASSGDGQFACPFGQAVREERDKNGGRRGLPGPAACAKERTCGRVIEELCEPRFQEGFRDFSERLLGEQGARMRQLLRERNGENARSEENRDINTKPLQTTNRY